MLGGVAPGRLHPADRVSAAGRPIRAGAQGDSATSSATRAPRRPRGCGAPVVEWTVLAIAVAYALPVANRPPPNVQFSKCAGVTAARAGNVSMR